MKSYFNPIALFTSLTLLGASLTGSAQEKAHQTKTHPEQVALQEIKQKVAGMREKAAKLKEMGRMEDSEALAAEAKKLYARLQERVERASNRLAKDAEAKKRAPRELLKDLEHRIETSHREFERHEGQSFRDRLRKHVESLEIDPEMRDRMRHLLGFGRPEMRERESEGHHEMRGPETRERSPEDHVRIAIDNLHAAGWHEVAERVEQEFHHRMEERHAREQEAGGPDLRRIMEEIERRFEEAHRQFQHLGEAVSEAHQRIDRLERHLHEREEHRD